jgi:hypothetical protein
VRRTRNIYLTGSDATLGRKRTRSCVTGLGAAAALVLVIATPASAFAPKGGKALGFGSTSFDDTAANRLTTCQNKFSGHVTVDKGDRQGGEISIDDITFSPCDPEVGISVTASNLPWTLKLDSRALLTIEGVDLNMNKGAGTCRYTGTLGGARSFDGVYTISGALTRRSSGCHGPQRLGLSVLAESISVNGAALNP